MTECTKPFPNSLPFSLFPPQKKKEKNFFLFSRFVVKLFSPTPTPSYQLYFLSNVSNRIDIKSNFGFWNRGEGELAKNISKLTKERKRKKFLTKFFHLLLRNPMENFKKFKLFLLILLFLGV